MLPSGVVVVVVVVVVSHHLSIINAMHLIADDLMTLDDEVHLPDLLDRKYLIDRARTAALLDERALKQMVGICSNMYRGAGARREVAVQTAVRKWAADAVGNHFKGAHAYLRKADAGIQTKAFPADVADGLVNVCPTSPVLGRRI